MTPADQLREAQLRRQRDAQDAGDIDALTKYEPFNRYWLRCLNQKIADTETSFKKDEMTMERREAVRQRLLAYEELRDMMRNHRASIQKALEAPPPVPGQRPMQAN